MRGIMTSVTMRSGQRASAVASAAAGGVAPPDRPAVQLGDLLRDGEPESRATERARRAAFRLPEAVEDQRAQLRRNAGAGVLHAERGAPAGDGQATAYGAACRGELERIREQVQEDALDLRGIELGPDLLRRLDREPDPALLAQAVEVPCDETHQPRQVDPGVARRHLAGLELRHVEEVVHVL